MNRRSVLGFLSATLLLACGPAPEPVAPTPSTTVSVTPVTPTATAAPSANAMTSETPVEFDPVRLGMTVQGVKKLCDDHIAAAQALLDELKNLKGAAADKL